MPCCTHEAVVRLLHVPVDVMFSTYNGLVMVESAGKDTTNTSRAKAPLITENGPPRSADSPPCAHTHTRTHTHTHTNMHGLIQRMLLI